MLFLLLHLPPWLWQTQGQHLVLTTPSAILHCCKRHRPHSCPSQCACTPGKETTWSWCFIVMSPWLQFAEFESFCLYVHEGNWSIVCFVWFLLFACFLIASLFNNFGIRSCWLRRRSWVVYTVYLCYELLLQGGPQGYLSCTGKHAGQMHAL